MFYGKAHRWTEFLDSFIAWMDTDPIVIPVLKLEYLRTQCKGTAHQAIAGLELSDAIKVLKGPFGFGRLILNSQIDAFMKINALSKTADVSELKRFNGTIVTHCRRLQSLGVDPKLYGIVLVNLMLQILPEEI